MRRTTAPGGRPVRRLSLFLIGLVTLAVTAGLTQAYRSKGTHLPTQSGGPLRAQLPAAATMRLFVIGDSGTADQRQLQVAAAMEQRCREAPVDGIIHVGDVFYPAGVDTADDPRWRERVFDPYGGPCLAGAPFFAVLGNHDYQGNVDAYMRMAQINPRWVQPHRFYERRFGDLLQLIAFDAWYPDLCFGADACAIDFLRQALANSRSRWQIVFGHYPLDSASARHPPGWRGWLLRRLLCDSSADLYLSGHVHHLEYRDRRDCRPGLVVSGGGGAMPYPVDDDPQAAYAEAVNGFVELEIDRDTLRLRFFDSQARLTYATLLTGTRHM